MKMKPNRMLIVFSCIGSVLLFLISCGSVPELSETSAASAKDKTETAEEADNSTQAPKGDHTAAEKEGTESDEDNSAFVRKLEDVYESGRNALGKGQTSEAIEGFIAILAEIDQSVMNGAKIQNLKEEVESQLVQLGSALNLEPNQEWIDPRGNQINGSTQNIGGENPLQPGVMLTLNTGSGKSVVSDAPIRFQFIKGSGVITGTVTTGEYGQANAAIVRLDNPQTEQVIRASLIYTVKDFTYEFKTLTRDFVYLPPENTATILVLERFEEGYMENPIIIDDTYRVLEELNVEFSPFNGVLIGDDYIDAYNGNQKLVRQIGDETGVSYLFFIFSDVHTVSQIKLGEKVYNIWKSQTNSTARIIRVEDARILYSQGVMNITGQGGTREKAVRDGLEKASSELMPKLSEDLEKISDLISMQLDD